ncbi:MAG: MTH1187 family thiamine-binding protein [Anaerolineales bacterium]
MKVIADFTIIPIGAGVSLSPYVAACEQVLAEAGLSTQLHANGTNVEGEWDEVMTAVKRCHETVHRMGAPRITTLLKIHTRTDRDQSMADKIASVETRLVEQRSRKTGSR